MKRWRFIVAGLAGAAVLTALAGPRGSIRSDRAPLGKDLETRTSCSTATAGCCAPMPRPKGAGGCRRRVKDVDPRFLRMLFAYEDKRFRDASRRRRWRRWRARPCSSSSSGHIVSGGSTFTMQVARLLEPREQRSLSAKLRQIARALELEHALEQERNPFALSDAGALWRQSRRHPRRVAALISARSRASCRSAKRRCWWRCRSRRKCAGRTVIPAVARAARDRVLDRAAAAGVVPRDEIARAKSQDGAA